jgi:CheY-specific phosphatase CheX
MSSSRIPQLGSELAETLTDVLSAVLGQEAEQTFEPMANGPRVVARLGIHDEITDGYTGVELQLSISLARVLASRMMFMADPAEDDILDAVAELGNIAAGCTKSLLYKHARLSLPGSEILAEASDSFAPGSQQVAAIVMGHVVQLTVIPDIDPDGLLWPPVVSDELLGRP